MKNTTIYKNCIIVKDDAFSGIYNTKTGELFSDEGSIESIKHQIDEFDDIEDNFNSTLIDKNGVLSKKIENIVICVSEKCNMKCKYCFANGGTYDNKCGRIMNYQDFKKIRKNLRNLSEEGISSFHFFGGEPLLNSEDIFVFCEDILADYEEKELKPPVFSITTNGTLITEKIADNMKNLKFFVGVSLDGPKEIHDSKRIFNDESGSFQSTMRGIRILQKKDIPIAVEATVCLEQFIDYSCEELEKYFSFFEKNGIACVGFFAEILDTDFEETMSDNIEKFFSVMVDFYFNILKNKNERPKIAFVNVINAIFLILGLQVTSVCLAGFNQVFVTSIGEIYPCQSYYAARKGCLGNIDDLDFDDSRRQLADGIQNRVPQKCNDCAYYKYCGNKCPGSNLLANGSEGIVSEVQCIIQKTIIDRVILNIVSLEEEPELKSAFENNLGTAYNISKNFKLDL